MIALLRYQAAMLLRSQRWLPPLLLYGIVLGIGVQSGQPVLDSLGYAAAAVLPAAAWMVRVCVTGEPASARAVTAAASAPWRVQLACVLTALGASSVLGCVGSVVVTLISDPRNDLRTVEVPLVPAAVAGVLATLACASLGTAAGALCNPPVLRRRGWPIPVTGLVALVVLVSAGSPANAAVRGLVSGSVSGHVAMPLIPLAVALLVGVAAVVLTCRLASRR